MPAEYFTFDEANKHKRHWQGVWAKVIWVDDAGENELAVIHWMGGGYKVVGRYRSDASELAKQHAERCSANGYCPTTPADSEGFRQHLSN
jgi:hypothetical protein